MTENLFDQIIELADATTRRLSPERLPWMWGSGLLMHDAKKEQCHGAYRLRLAVRRMAIAIRNQ